MIIIMNEMAVLTSIKEKKINWNKKRYINLPYFEYKFIKTRKIFSYYLLFQFIHFNSPNCFPYEFVSHFEKPQLFAIAVKIITIFSKYYNFITFGKITVQNKLTTQISLRKKLWQKNNKCKALLRPQKSNLINY